MECKMTLWIGNGAVLNISSQWQFKRILKIDNSWPELFNFQNSFNCHILRRYEWDLLVFCK